MPSKSKESVLKEKINFEKSIHSLEELVNILESGKCGLDESLEHFEKGIQLYKQCKMHLGETEKKIKILIDGLKEEDF